MSKLIGKIRKVSFGIGGYQDAMIGISFTLGGEGWGCGDFWGWWKNRSADAEWSIEDQKYKYATTVSRLATLLEHAKVSDIKQLEDIPIEAEFNGNYSLVGWRILTEAI